VSLGIFTVAIARTFHMWQQSTNSADRIAAIAAESEASGLSEYERQRLRTIEQNRLMLQVTTVYTPRCLIAYVSILSYHDPHCLIDPSHRDESKCCSAQTLGVNADKNALAESVHREPIIERRSVE
jgi:hypothetical protein